MTTSFDRIELLHRRLALFMGDVWAEQLIIYINEQARSGPMSYEQLLEQAVADVLDNQFRK